VECFIKTNEKIQPLDLEVHKKCHVFIVFKLSLKLERKFILKKLMEPDIRAIRLSNDLAEIF
jgi:hypothetical protein